MHLFDFGLAPEYHLIYRKPVTPTSVMVIESTESSLSIAWDVELPAMAYYSIHLKHAALTDIYYRAVKTYLPKDITTHTIEGLASGTSYSIKLIIGQDGLFNHVGEIEGRTKGTSLCGDGVINTGEECDAGEDNGSTNSDCNSECVVTVVMLPTQARTNYPLCHEELPPKFFIMFLLPLLISCYYLKEPNQNIQYTNKKYGM